MSCWFGGTVSGRDSAYHVEYDTSLGGLTIVARPYFNTAAGTVQVIDWGDGSPLEVWNGLGYDWTTYSLNHTYATSGIYRIKAWWLPSDSTQNPSSDIYGYTFGHPKEGRFDWIAQPNYTNNFSQGMVELINFGPASPRFLADDYLNHANLSMTYLQDGLKEDLDTRYLSYRWASGCKLKNTYNPKVWAMFDTRKTTAMQDFFNNVTNRNSGLSFNPDVTMWDVSNVLTMYSMFAYLDGFDQDLGNWDVSSATRMDAMFIDCFLFNNGGSTGIGDWDVSNVTNMTNMFLNARTFNQPIGNWDVSNVTITFQMFGGAYSFNQDLSNWDLSSCTNTRRMFQNCTSLTNGGVSNMNVSNNLQFAQMFAGCSNFDADLSTPYWLAGISAAASNNLSTAIQQMFQNCYSFNNGGSTGIGDWNVSGCSNFLALFQNCVVFNQDLSNWDLSSATTLNSMFFAANVFNNGGATGIGDWNVSNVTDMTNLFLNAFVFNQDISGWDTSSVTSMLNMFQSARAFNQDISGWDTSSVSNFFRIFRSTQAFDQDLGNWSLASATNVGDFFLNATGLSDENYSRLLVGWANFVYDNSGPYNLTFNSNSTKYNNTTYTGYGSGQFTDAVTARAYLTGATGGWTITDQGQA